MGSGALAQSFWFPGITEFGSAVCSVCMVPTVRPICFEYWDYRCRLLGSFPSY